MSINNKRSYTEYTVTQPTTDFAIGFDDFDEGGKDNILVTLNGVLVESLGYAAIRKNESTVSITPAITEGTVRLTRETDIDEPFHKFTAGALFSAKSMDENFQQVRHSQQEVRDGFVFLEYNTNGIVQASKEATAQAKAATVTATASAVRAETAADTAVQAVGSLQGVVDAATAATTKANAATATASTAASQATAATTSAQNAALAADTAKQEAAAAAANANAATVDTLAATGRANEAADVVADLVVGKVRAQDVTATANAAGSVPRTQHDINSEYTSIETFGGDFAVAGAWLSQSSQHVLNLKPDTTYNLQTSTTPVYFNRIVCRDGTAVVNILGTGQLTLESSVTGNNDRLHLEGLDVRWEGRRVGVLHEGAEFYPKHIIDPKVYVFKTATLKNLTFRALTNLSDVNSFSDTIGKTRGRLGLSYNVTEWSDVTDVKTYGVGFVAQIAPAAEGCYHREERITSYDVETIIYLPQLSFEWESGETHHIKGVNTKAQQSYWYAKDDPDLSKKQYINGKDCVMCEANHSVMHNISNITSENMIEKSVYAQSRNTRVTRTIDRGTDAPAAIKSTLTPKPNSNAVGSDVYYEGKAGVVECYGWNNIVLDNHIIKNELKPSGRQLQRWAFQASGSDNVTLRNSEIHNTETAVYLTDAKILTVDNVWFYGVGGIDNPALVYVPVSYDETRKIVVDFTSKTGVTKKVIVNSRFPAHNEWIFDPASDKEGVTIAAVSGVITIAASAIDTTKTITVNTFNPQGVSTINNPDTSPVITSQNAVVAGDLSVTVTHKPAFVSYSPESITLKNVTGTYTPKTLSEGVYGVALLAPRAKKVLVDNVHGFPFSLLPFKTDKNHANKVEVLNSSFDLFGQYTLADNIVEIFKAGTDFVASRFDFVVNVMSAYVFGSAIPTKVYRVRYKKLNDTGLVPCRDYWHSINLSYDQATEGQIQSIYNLSPLPPHSFKCVARYRDNYIEFYYNKTTGVKTLVHAIGTDIVDMAVFVGNAGTTAAERGENKFNVYVLDGKLVLLLGYDRWQKPYTGVVEVELTKL